MLKTYTYLLFSFGFQNVHAVTLCYSNRSAGLTFSFVKALRSIANYILVIFLIANISKVRESFTYQIEKEYELIDTVER